VVYKFSVHIGDHSTRGPGLILQKPADGQAYSESLARPFGNTAQYLPFIFDVFEAVYDSDCSQKASLCTLDQSFDT